MFLSALRRSSPGETRRYLTLTTVQAEQPTYTKRAQRTSQFATRMETSTLLYRAKKPSFLCECAFATRPRRGHARSYDAVTPLPEFPQPDDSPSQEHWRRESGRPTHVSSLRRRHWLTKLVTDRRVTRHKARLAIQFGSAPQLLFQVTTSRKKKHVGNGPQESCHGKQPDTYNPCMHRPCGHSVESAFRHRRFCKGTRERATWRGVEAGLVPQEKNRSQTREAVSGLHLVSLKHREAKTNRASIA